MEKEGRRELFRRLEEPEGEWITLFSRKGMFISIFPIVQVMKALTKLLLGPQLLTWYASEKRCGKQTKSRRNRRKRNLMKFGEDNVSFRSPHISRQRVQRT